VGAELLVLPHRNLQFTNHESKLPSKDRCHSQGQTRRQTYSKDSHYAPPCDGTTESLEIKAARFDKQR